MIHLRYQKHPEWFSCSPNEVFRDDFERISFFVLVLVMFRGVFRTIPSSIYTGTIEHLCWNFLGKIGSGLKPVNYFCNTLHHRCLTRC